MRSKHVAVILALLAVIGGLFLLVSCGGSAGGGTIKIGALLAVTGPASYLGEPEKKTLEMFVDKINKSGGINGNQIELIVKDTQAKADNAISFAKQLIEEDKVLAIIGPTTSGESMQIKDLCEANKMILISCAAAETIVDPVAKYVFKTPQKDSFAAMRIYEDIKARGLKRVGVVVSNSGFGQGGKAQLEKYAAEYGLEIVISEVYDAKATDLTDVMAKVKAKNVDAVVNWSIEPAQSIVIMNMRQIGMKQPLYQSHGFGNIKYVETAGAAAEGVIFPAGRMLGVEVLPDNNPQKKIIADYIKEYEALYSEEVSTFGGHAYDALMIIKKAIEIAGNTERDAVRDAIEKVKNFPGTGGVFNFSASDHNGLDKEAFEMFVVKDGKFSLYKK